MMAKRKLVTPKPKKKIHRVNVFQIHVKGPERNKCFIALMGRLSKSLLSGKPLVRENRYGCVIRSLGGNIDNEAGALRLDLVKYNSNTTGLAWDTTKKEIVTGAVQVTAQRSELVVYLEHHFAVLERKPHGPTPSELTEYLQTILTQAMVDLKLDCSIEVVPLKVGGSSQEIRHWKVIKKFSIEVIRPNPSPSVQAEKLRQLLLATDADKGKVEVESKTVTGIKFSGIREYVEEGDYLVTHGQGHMSAVGVSTENDKVEFDSKKQKVQKFSLETTDDDRRTTPVLFFEKLKKFLFNRNGSLKK